MGTKFMLRRIGFTALLMQPTAMLRISILRVYGFRDADKEATLL
jgi:hypothetical protein